MDLKLKKMPQLRGEAPIFYSRETIQNMCLTINALARAIDFLAEKVEKRESQVQKNETQ